ncbi:MAG: acetylesterase [Clostridia bacterium]|nr:acetylesterase [Clostridia bacterium]
MAVFTGQYYSAARRGFVSFSAVLPVDILDEKGRPAYLPGPFPTLYLLHGYSGNHMDWLYNGLVAQLAVKHRLAIIMPSGDNSFYLNNPFSGQAYSDFIGHELVDVTRRMFPLSHKREDTFIGGLSMGGFGALRSGLYFNDVFSAVIALSSALITDEIAHMKPGEHNGVASYDYYANTFGDLSTLPDSDRAPKALAAKRQAAGEALPRIFMACGTEDFLYPNNLDMHQYLETLGIAHAWVTHPGVHDFDFWNYALPIALNWLQEERKETSNHE